MEDVNKWVIFENISSNDFVGKWNGKEYPVIKAGETRKLPLYLAKHFSKHLANQALPNGAEITEKDSRKLNFRKSCIHDLEVESTFIDETEMLVQEMNEVEEKPEEEFEELKEIDEDIKKTTTKASGSSKGRPKKG